MTSRILGALAAVMAVVALAPVPLGGQTASKRSEAAKAVPRTPDGRPDFQGYWTNATFIPLERPAEFAGKAEMTEAEAIAYQKKRELQENSQSKEDIHYDNVLWQTESYSKGMPDRRTSLIFDPADGKIPPLTPAAQARAAARAAAARRRGPADAAEYRSLGERCISWGNEGPPMLGATYGNNIHILQSGSDVVIRHELMRRHPRHPDGWKAACRTEPPHAERRLRAAAGKATRWSSTRPTSPTGRRSGDRRRRPGRHLLRRTDARGGALHARGRRHHPLPVHRRRPRRPGCGPGRRSSSCDGGKARFTSMRAVKATTVSTFILTAARALERGQ